MEYLYIFRIYIKGGSLLKFGYTSDIWGRLFQYKFANPGIEIVYIAQLANAFEIEQEFHNLNIATVGKEWYDKIKELEYHVGNVKKNTAQFNHKSHSDKIESYISSFNEIGIGLFVLSAKLKEIFSETYKNLKVNRVAKATDLQDFYNVKAASKKKDFR